MFCQLERIVFSSRNCQFLPEKLTVSAFETNRYRIAVYLRPILASTTLTT